MNLPFFRFTFFLLMSLTLPLTATAQVVDIPDPNLRAVIENALGEVSSATITTADMATLTRLDANEAGISDLTGLEHATNLRDLHLWSNSVSDLSSLAGLTKLTGLYLGGSSASDLSPLVGLTNLESLFLDANGISNLSALAGLTKLTRLALSNNSVSDLSPLAGLTSLRWMRLAGNNISDLSPLVTNTGLGDGDELEIQGNPLSHTSIKTHIPTLQGRGVTVKFDDTTNLNGTVEFDNTESLNVGEPRTVRLIYFLPSDRSPQRDIDVKMDTLIREVQQFYADEMERHGFEEKTFTFENDATGKTVVHRVDGQFTDSYYHQGTFGKVSKEIAEKFDMPQHIYFVAVDISSELIDSWCGEASRFWDRGGREFIIPASGHCFNVLTTAHELGHAFGLDHDFRNDTYIMSYGSNRIRLSKCAAEWLDAHRFFNSSQTSFNESARTNKSAAIQMFPPLAYSPNAIRLRFEVTDTDGLHQAQLIIPTTAADPVEGSRIKLHGCKSLNGESNTIEFITTELTMEPATEVILQVIDVYGGITRSRFAFTKDDILPDQNARTPTKLEKISGDNQQGLSVTPLPNPLVVKVTDQNGIAFEEVVVTFTVTAGDGMLSATRTTTDENGRAESTFTLGPNLGTNIVEVSAAGITVTFNAVVGAAVDIPDPNLRAAIETALSKAQGEPIAPSEMSILMRLEAPEAGVRNLTGLEHATNLTYLDFWKSSVSDISPVAGLTKLTHLGFVDNNVISDISALAGLTNLTALWVNGNNISDISPLAGLTKLSRLGLDNNNISDISALAGLTNLSLLNLRSNSILDISPLANLTKLTKLRLGGNSVSDISAVAGLTQLESLSLWANSISNSSPVEGLTNLTELNLSGNSISSIVSVAGLTQMTWLHLQSNRISDISALAGLTNLTALRLDRNSISDISALSSLTHLTELRLDRNSITDLSPLVANTGLGSGDEVDVRGNPLSYLSIHTHIPALQSRGVTVEFDNQAHPALLKISGDSQKGASFAPLSQPFVVEAQDANGSALAGVSVRFAVTTGGGTLSTTITRTDENGRAQSTLTLGPNLGTNTVEVSAAGIDVPATFHAISDTEAPPIIVDVNGDGSVNILDLILIASKLGNTGTNLVVDVNRDGTVSILDLVLAAGMFDGAAAAPSVQPQVPEILTAVEVQGWLTDARALEVRDSIVKRGFLVLEQLLVSLTPTETELLPNYPNPFNPETWIPYRLAEDAFVTLTIYDGSGQVVRTLEVGHRIASAYENRSKAIYWDGRNEVGEQVASGVYFYNLSTGNYSATRRMVILK